jgi:spore coat protein U-like protein
MYFGDVTNINSAQQTATGSITVSCSSGTKYNVDLHSAADVGNPYRTLKGVTNVANTLMYNLYQDASYSTVWGTDVGGVALAGQTGTGAPQSINVYGQMPTQGSASPNFDNYQEAVTINITY